MCSAPDREKISEKILKEWENIDDEALIKEVATKGKYLNLLFHFLARRNQKSLKETRDYFNTEVDQYVHRLLANRQVHKAELVLTNVGRVSQIIFYEFIQSSSREHIDEEIKEYVLEHISKCSSTFESNRDEYDYYLLVLRLIRSHKTLKKVYEGQIPGLSLESLYHLDDKFRQKLAIDVCFQCKNATLVERLDRRLTWYYLLRNEQFYYVAKWLDLYYENCTGGSLESKYVTKELTYDVAIRNLFLSWEIDKDMFELIHEPSIEERLKEFMLYSLAKHGFFISAEKDDILKQLHRVYTTESHESNAEWLNSVPNMLKIVRIACDRDELGLLADQMFSKKVLQEASTEYPALKNEFDVCQMLKDIDLNDPEHVSRISKRISRYIIETSDEDFYMKYPLVYFAEHFLQKNVSNDDLINNCEARTILSKVPFFDGFLNKLATTTSYNDQKTTLNDLLLLINIDMSLVRNEVLPSPNSDEPVEPISFANRILAQKYGQPTTLSYIHYIKQHRSSYAVYQFFVEQLQNYSQISRSQIHVICGAVMDLAVNSLDDPVLITHCVAFMEMLGVNTMALRAYLKCLKIVRAEDGSVMMAENEVMKRVEEILLQKLQQNQCRVDPNEMDALRIVTLARGLEMPISFLKCIAENSNWFHFMLFASYYNYSIRAMVNVCQLDCVPNRNIGLNVGRALKEIIVDDEMATARRTSSFSYREHRKKVHSKSESSHSVNPSQNRALLTSHSVIESMTVPANKFISSQYLNIIDDHDIFAIILMSTVEGETIRESTINVKTLKDLMKNRDKLQATTYLNLLRFAFKLKWPMLAVIAAMTNDAARDYCWAAWMIISMGMSSIGDDLKTLEQLSRKLITSAVDNRFVRTLHQSMQIFYAESYFVLFSGYLSNTSRYNFSSEVTKSMQTYLGELSNNNVTLSCLTNYHRDEMLDLTIAMLISYVATGFDSREHRQLLLETLGAAGIDDYVTTINFGKVEAIDKILNFTTVKLNVLTLLRTPSADDLDEESLQNLHFNRIRTEYERIVEDLIMEKSFVEAKAIADLVELPKDIIVYENWLYEYETNSKFDVDQCEREMNEMALSPVLFINFLLLVADKLKYEDPIKYNLLKRVLDVIKRHHLHSGKNVSIDRIEYELVMCMLKNSVAIGAHELYHSEYFEVVMVNERVVLFKSFMMLKRSAGVDDMSVINREPLNNYELGRLEELMNRLLDMGDIIQALRLQVNWGLTHQEMNYVSLAFIYLPQAMFNHRTLDLHYLVFCMALAEGLASLYELSVEQKQMLNDSAKSAASKFNRRTLRLARRSQSSTSSSPNSRTYMESLESTRSDIEEVSTKEKQDLLEAIQSLASRVQHGFRLAQRIAMVFRSAMFLDKEYLDVLKAKDPLILLNSTANSDCLNRLIVMSDIMTSMQMRGEEIAEFISDQMAKSIIKSRFYLFQSATHLSDDGLNMLWGYDLDKDFHLLLELCPNTSSLGNFLLKYCDVLRIYRKFDAIKNAEPEFNAPQKDKPEMRQMFNKLRQIMENQPLSHKKQNMITVELLLKAHDCFVHECSMEGIANILHRCKSIVNTLTTTKSWHLIVRLLMGIRRYRDMYYCFEKLIDNEQFESLLGQFDEERAIGLKEAIIRYLREYYPEDREKYRLTALHFQMYAELAHAAELEAKTTLIAVVGMNEIKLETSSTASFSFSSLSVDRTQSEASEHSSMPSNADQTISSVSGASSGGGGGSGSSSNNNNSRDTNASLARAGCAVLKCKRIILEQLQSAMDNYAHAAENHLLLNKLGKAQNSASQAELIALQMHLVTVALEAGKDTCLSVLNIRSETAFRYMVAYELGVPQALILSRSHPYEINWSEAIFNQFIMQGKQSYIDDYLARMTLSEDMIEVIVKNYMQQTALIAATTQMEQKISLIVDLVESVTLRYKLASLLSDKRIIANLINNSCIYYLKDTNYGRNDSP